VLAAIVALAAVGMAFGVLDGLAKRDLLSHPPVGQARITGTTLQYGRYGSSGRVYWQRDGEREEHWCSVSLFDARTPKGTVVDVRRYTFLGKPRDLVEPCARRAQAEAMRQVGFLAAGIVLCVGGAVFLTRWARRVNRVLRDGAPAVGRIEDAQRIGVGGKARYRMRYRFDAGGQTIEARRSVSRRRARMLFGDEGPRDGDGIEVVYDPRDPRKLHEIWGKRGG
jgi:hypothetical protein